MTLREAAMLALCELDATLPVWAWDTTAARMRVASDVAPGLDVLVLAERVVAGVVRDLGAGRLERVL